MLVSLVLMPTNVDAVECTDAQTALADSIWAAAASTSACSPYVTQTNPVYVNAPCTATDCVAVVEGVAKDLPDCTFSGISNKIEVENALTACNGGDTKDAGTLTFSSTASSSSQANTNTLLPSTASSSSQAGTNTLLPSTASSSSQAGTNTLSPSTASSLSHAGTNTLSPSTASSSALMLGSKGSSSSCSTTESTDMWKLYVSTAKSDACTGNAVVNGYSVNIVTQCNSTCAGKIKDLADELPDCYFDFEHMDKKKDVLDQLGACNGTSGYVTISIYRDTKIALGSSSGSTSIVTSSHTSSGTGLPPSGGNKGNNILGSSNSKAGNSASGPRAHEGKLYLWVVTTLFAAVVVAYSS
ncbi:GP-anchored serine-rich Elicitin INL13 [Phytophthora cinnamomi]|uniref:GP-anchored serine-rich Elicitin INL13 n=1 Tax=Phytophthora cinnamomi TaxID=4785 RepID=UPI003559D263|nr:GP-anchored serine-rich Elicitin INL13 [Phytophthora cinnamomi]